MKVRIFLGASGEPTYAHELQVKAGQSVEFKRERLGLVVARFYDVKDKLFVIPVDRLIEIDPKE